MGVHVDKDMHEKNKNIQIEWRWRLNENAIVCFLGAIRNNESKYIVDNGQKV